MNEKEGYVLIGKGYNVAELEGITVEGPAWNVSTPNDVLTVIKTGKVKDHLLVSPGGTTTFLAPVLTRKTKGVITYAGSPESHLGIVSREYRIPCIMTLALEEGISEIPNDAPILMDVSQPKVAYVYMKEAYMKEKGIKV